MKALLIIILLLTMLMQLTLAQHVSLIEGNVAYYPFNGNSNDESGNGNHGTVVNAELVADRNGNMNAAYWFNGVSSYIIVPDDETLDITGDISIAGWMKKNSEQAWASMVTKGGDTGALEENNYTLHNSDIGGAVFTSYLNPCYSSVHIPLNEWHFVVFVREGNSGKFFIDGILDSQSITLIEGDFTANNSNLYIGVDFPGEAEFFHGSLDDIRIFSRALNQEEVTLLFLGTFTRSEVDYRCNAKELIIRPNPVIFKNSFTISIPDYSVKKIWIFDDLGKLVYISNDWDSNSIELNAQCLNIAAGWYNILIVGNKMYRSKLIINH